MATTPYSNDIYLEDLDLLEGLVALIFGSEVYGVSDQVLEQADECFKILMCRFTESFNVFVSAVIILYHFTWELGESELPWRLSPKEKKEIELEWMKRTVKRSDLIEAEFLRLQQQRGKLIFKGVFPSQIF